MKKYFIWPFTGLVMFTLTISCGNNGASTGMAPNNSNQNSNNDCEVLVSGLSFIFGQSSQPYALGRIVSDGNNIFWYGNQNTSWAIEKAPVTGGQAIVLAGQLGGVNDFLHDSTSLFWSEHDIQSGEGKIMKVNETDGTQTILAQGKPEEPNGSVSPYDVFFPEGLTLETDSVCWGEEAGDAAIRCVSRDGGKVFDHGRGDKFKPMSLANDANYFYILDAHNNGQVLRLSKVSNKLDTLAHGFATTQALFSLMLDSGKLYWVETKDNGSVFMMSASGGAITVVDQNLSNPRVVVTDADNIYYAAGDGVFKISKSGGASQKLDICSNILSSVYVAVGNQDAYVVDSQNNQAGMGQIVKVAK